MPDSGFDNLFGDDAGDGLDPGAVRGPISLTKAATGGGLDDIGGIATLIRPVTKNTLARVFGMDVQTIARRLVACPSTGQGNRRLYDFKEAVAYIIKPKMTPKEFIKTLNAADMPPQINKHFWDSQRSRIRYMLEAQESWDSEDVLTVLGESFMLIKDTLQMATEEVRERAKLTDEQAVLFEQFIDDLRKALRQKLVDMPKQKQTTSMLKTDLFGTSADIDPAEDEHYVREGDDLDDD